MKPWSNLLGLAFFIENEIENDRERKSQRKKKADCGIAASGPDNDCKRASAACRQGLTFVGRKRGKTKEKKDKKK